MPDSERNPHVARVGWSTDSSNLNVGEDKLSYGYGGTGKSSWNNKFYDYGQPYTVNDVITCFIDFDERCIFFAKNGLYLGKAFDLGQEMPGTAFYPHVTIKNMKVKVNFGYYTPRVPPCAPGFMMLENVPKHMLVRGTRGPDNRRESQVIMMVGLPGAGKTVWANKYSLEHNEMRINILGTNAIMDKMKVTGLTRQRNYHGRWDQLIKQATNVLNQIFKIAEKKTRNYIIDQTNVYPNARRKKMASFHGFHRIAAVVVNTNDVLHQRIEKREREEGKIVPDKAVMEMKKNFTLPEVGESFDDVWFIEEDQQNSARLVEEFRVEGKMFLEREAEKEREEMKRKRENPSASGEPPAKEPYKSSGENQYQDHHLTRNQSDNEGKRLSSRGQSGHEASGYQLRHQEPFHSHYPPRDHGSFNSSAPHYPPRDHGSYNSSAPHYPPRDHGSYTSSAPHYPPRDHGSYNSSAPHHYPSRSHGSYSQQCPPGEQRSHDPFGHSSQPQDFYHNYQQTQIYSYTGGYRCNPHLPVQEESQRGGCTQYDSLINPPRGQAQEHVYSGYDQSNDARYHGNTQRPRNYSNYHNTGNRR